MSTHWLDADGVVVEDGAWVALAGARLYPHARLIDGVVIGRGESRLRVVFDDRERAVRPSMVRVVSPTGEREIKDLRLLPAMVEPGHRYCENCFQHLSSLAGGDE